AGSRHRRLARHGELPGATAVVAGIRARVAASSPAHSRTTRRGSADAPEARMPKKDARIDAYIAKAKPFAQPILKHLRATVMSASPELEETIKWGMPAFTYHGLVCGMAGFKEHVTFGFWKSKLILNTKGMPVDEAMGQFGRITKLSELPSKSALVGYVRRA